MTSRWVVHKEREPYDVYVGRPSPFGNPYSHKPSTHAAFRVATRDEAIAKYRTWLMAQPELVAKVKRELKGKVLGCWCAPEKACHGEVLAEIANEGEAREQVTSEVVPHRGAGRIICLDTEYDARYSDLGIGRLACMSYSLHPGHAAIAGPSEAVALWSAWVDDPDVTLLGHSLYNDVAVLAQETHRRTTGEDCVPGFGPAWESAHRLYESDRALDTEIHQRLTHIRFGPHKASVALGDLVKQLFGEDKSDSKSVPDEVKALLRDAVPYADWPTDLLERAPHRVKFGYYLETYGEDLGRWPAEAVDYALDDAREPWRLHDWQQRRWNGREIPDAKMQVKHSWMLHLVSIPGWVADRERAAAIRERYRDVIAHCDRTLVDCGILHAPGRKLTAKRGALQGVITNAFDGNPPLTKSLVKSATPEQLAELTPIERRDAAATDAKVTKKAIERAGGRVLTLAEALAADDARALCTATGASLAPLDPVCILNAHRLYGDACKAAKKGGENAARAEVVAENLLPLLVLAGLIEVSHPRTIKKDRVADYVYAILGDEAPLSKTAAETIFNPTPEERRKHCSTAAKTVRQAILHAEGSPLNVTDAVVKAEGSAEDFDAWLAKSGQPELNAYAVRSKADKTITNFLDRLDTNRRIRTTYQTLVDTGRTSSRGSGGPGTLNVQQLPRDYDKPAHLHTRGCILPDPGWAFIVADYTQLELCSLAHVLTQLVRFYARNPTLKHVAESKLGFAISEHYESTLSRAINADRDCHVLMASVLRGHGESYEECYALYERADQKKAAKEPLDKYEKQIIDDRQLAKPCNFGFPGGLGELKFIDYAAGYGVTITLPTAKRAKAAYMLTWPEMKLYFYHIGRMCELAGGEAVLHQFVSNRERGGCYFTKACNGFFQSLAADGAKYAGQLLVKHAYRVPSSPMYGTRPSGFVHDEYLVNARREQAPLALPEVERLMVEAMQVYIPDVKIKAPGKVLYERWGK